MALIDTIFFFIIRRMVDSLKLLKLMRKSRKEVLLMPLLNKIKWKPEEIYLIKSTTSVQLDQIRVSLLLRLCIIQLKRKD